jgi:probable rRNA maturation factor
MSSDGSTLLFRALPAELRLSAEEKRTLKAFFRNLCNRLAEPRSVVCLIADDRELQRLNLQFLGRDYPTDVLSFPSDDKQPALGEIAISVERAAAQAAEFGHTRVDEIRILMLHGVLHLTGLDHERDRGEMAQAERKWCAEFELPSTLTERAGLVGRTLARCGLQSAPEVPSL